jgi:hypothetical protein
MLGLSPAAQISPAPIPRDPTATSRHGTQAGTEARARDAQGFLGSSLGLVSHKLSQQTAKPDKISKSSKNDQKVSKEFLAGYVSKNLGTMEVQRSLHRPRPEEQKVARAPGAEQRSWWCEMLRGPVNLGDPWRDVRGPYWCHNHQNFSN